jgi:hypothetical protein
MPRRVTRTRRRERSASHVVEEGHAMGGGRWWWVGVVAALVLGAALPAAVGAQSHEVADYVILGIDEVTLRGRITLSSGDTGVTAGTLRVGPRVHAANAAASTIVVRRRTALEQLFCNTLVLRRGGAFEPCLPLVAPLVSTLPSFTPVSVDPEAPVIVLPPRALRVLAPGDYAEVTLGARARLTLAEGSYDIGRLTVGRLARLDCTGPCAVNVRDRALVKRRGRLQPGSGGAAADVRLNVASTDTRRALRVQGRAVVQATVYVPNGTMVLGGGRYTGAFFARRLVAEGRARFELASGFASVPVPAGP